ncbi:Cleavage stimulating factor 64 [Quillaja saponaria]|uniref:Cleavage stimulating factor 64 n=1 Tax=Quillaja saponaria TaxID=32244 RepID=A0AAD7PW21_QUISA|nr:Cleavage stimulating factor 64 [Quillaja saponaria]
MAGKQVGGDGLSANIAGMSKNQLYDIMSQMKTLIEQNQQQARQILIQNPLLTKALFQAQIMLGMVQPPHVVPNIQPSVSQNTQQSVQPTQQANIQSAPLLPGQAGMQDPAGQSQIQVPSRKQHQNQPAVSISSAPAPAVNHPSQPMHPHALQMPQQPKGHLNPQINPMSLPRSSQIPNIPPSSIHFSQPLHQHQMPVASSQLQQPMQGTGFPHLPLQQPLPPQPRLPSAPTFQHQYPLQMGPNLGFQHGGAPHNLQQSMFHSGTKPNISVGPTFPQGQPAIPSQPPTQSLYQAGGSHLGTEFSNQVGNAMQADRGTSWMTSRPENPSLTQLPGLPGPPSIAHGQIGTGNQPSRSQALTPDMEKALLQQVMSLTPEQINLLPPEQRNQVVQLQQMLRQ